MRAVNLLPKDVVQHRGAPKNLPAIVATVAAVIISGLLAMAYLSASGKVNEKQAALDSVNAELALIPPPQTRPSGEQQLATDQESRAKILSAALQRRVAWDRVLREISLVLPDDVWLSTLNANAPLPSSNPTATAPIDGAPPTGFTMMGYTYSHDHVARLLSRLQVLPSLTNVELKRSARNDLVVEFQIMADVRVPGASQ